MSGVYFEEVDSTVLDLAREVIDQWHPALKDARIGFIFRYPAAKSHGGTVLASIMRPSKTTHYLTKLDYIVTIAQQEWSRANRARRLAVLDHEFCHAGEDDNGNWTILPHDVQEFVAVIDRHGLWKADLQALGEAVKSAQDRLPGIVEEKQPDGELVAMTRGQFYDATAVAK